MARTVRQQRNTPRTITVELTEGEADAILGLTGRVGGHPTRSGRKYMNRLQRVLTRSLGYGYEDTDFYKYGRGFMYQDEFEPRSEATKRLDDATYEVNKILMDVDLEDMLNAAKPSTPRRVRDVVGEVDELDWQDSNVSRAIQAGEVQYNDSNETVKESTWRALSRWASRKL